MEGRGEGRVEMLLREAASLPGQAHSRQPRLLLGGGRAVSVMSERRAELLTAM